jgi:hypothetical protein
MYDIRDGVSDPTLEVPIDSGIALSIRIDNLGVFINKTLSTESLINQLLIKRAVGVSDNDKTEILPPFGVRGCPITRASCPILILPILILRITTLIVVVSICPYLVLVGSRVPLVWCLGILLIPSVSLFNH